MNPIVSRNAGVLPPELAGTMPERLKGAKAAREFEAHLIGSLLQSLEKTFSALPGEGTMAGADDYNYLGTQALCEGLSDHGGFGIASMIARHLPVHEGKG